MAKRTINRMPMTRDTDLAEDVNYSYANFAAPKGLCDDKNYLGIDQQTFEDVNNVYIDSDGQLSSRPKLTNKVINVLPNEYVKIYKIFNVHGVVFYHVYNDSDDPHNEIVFMHDNKWIGHICGKDINIGWFDNKFYFFTNNDIFAYDYDEGWLGIDNIIYTPITKQVRDGVITTYENDATIDTPNIFGGGERTRYFYNAKSSDIYWNDLIGKDVTFVLNGIEYSGTFVKDKQYTFVAPLTTIDITDAAINDYGQIIAWSDLLSGTYYYSLDGITFVKLPSIGDYHVPGSSSIPAAEQLYYIVSKPVLSQDGSKLYALVTYIKGSDTIENYILYSLDLTTEGYKWTSATKRANKPYNGFTMTRRYNTTGKTIIGYCNDGSENKVVFIRKASIGKSIDTSAYPNLYLLGYMVYTFNGTSLFDFFVPVNAIRDMSGVMPNDDKTTVDLILATKSNKTTLLVKHSTMHKNSESVRYYDPDATFGYSKGDNGVQQVIDVIMLNNDMIPYSTKNSTYISKFAKPYGIDYVIKHININTATNENIKYLNQYYGTNPDSGHLYSFLLTEGLTVNELNINTIAYFKNLSALKYKEPNVIDSNIIDVYNVVCSLSQINDGSISNDSYGAYGVWFTESDVISKIFSTNELSNKEPNNYEYVLTNYNNEYLILTSRSLYIYYYDVMNNDYKLLNEIKLLIDEKDNVKPISAFYRYGVLYVRNNQLYGVIFSDKDFIVDVIVKADYNYIIPSFIQEFANEVIINVIAYENKINWQTPEYNFNKGLLYFATINEQSFPTDVTALSLLSATELSIFFDNEIYILQYTNLGYRLLRSKLQLGCRKGYDVLLNYDGATALLCTIKGLTTISYQDFVQSTDQVFTYLSENIMDTYSNFDISPIKLYQYKNWIVLYRQDCNEVYIYDLRNNSWWKWSFDKIYGNVQQVIYDNKQLIILINDKMYTLINDEHSYTDFDYATINWHFRSQKLHFDAPNNYKHINQLLITSTQSAGKPFVFNLQLTCYRNLIDVSDKVAYDYEVDGLKTFIKRMNIMKINAFQFELSNYNKQNSPRQFTTPNIAIKYRITERIR